MYRKRWATGRSGLRNGLGRQLWAAADPALAARLTSFRRVSARVPSTAHGRSVAVIGRSPGCGTSTVVALMALAAAGSTDNRVIVLDTDSDSPTRADTRAGRSVAALLGRYGNDRGAPAGNTSAGDGARTGDPARAVDAADGRLPILLASPDGEPVARSRVRAAGSPGTAVPVLALPAGAGGFPPQMLAATLDRLRLRADLILLDTPTDPGRPVFHAALHLVDHVLLVIPADRFAAQRLAAARNWLAAVPGPERSYDLSVALVAQTTFVPRWRPDDLPWTVLRRDGALARGRVGAMSRGSAVGALELLARVSAPQGQAGRRGSAG